MALPLSEMIPASRSARVDSASSGVLPSAETSSCRSSDCHSSRSRESDTSWRNCTGVFFDGPCFSSRPSEASAASVGSGAADGSPHSRLPRARRSASAFGLGCCCEMVAPVNGPASPVASGDDCAAATRRCGGPGSCDAVGRSSAAGRQAAARADDGGGGSEV